jgi:hypothetical protein
MKLGILVVEKCGAHISLLGISDFAGKRLSAILSLRFRQREEVKRRCYVQICKSKSKNFYVAYLIEMIWGIWWSYSYTQGRKATDFFEYLCSNPCD